MNNLKVTMIEGDQVRTEEVINTRSYEDCVQTIEAHHSYGGNIEDYFFQQYNDDGEVVNTITLDHVNKTVKIED